MQAGSRVYACGSNLHQQIRDHDQEGEPLCIPSPVLLTSHNANVTKVLAVSASQVVYELSHDGIQRVGRKGFSSAFGLEVEALCRSHEISCWLGRDVLEAFTLKDGDLYTLKRMQSAVKASSAAMDSHGRVLVLADGRLRLYASQNDLYNGDYSEVNFSGPHIDLSQANVYAGAAHFILLMKGEAGRTLVYGVGDNRFFQQGHQGPSSWTKATLLEFFDEGTSSILKVACGDLHTAFLTEDGALYMSGSNANGQCGGFSEQEPCLVTFKVEDGAESDIDVIDIACGANHTLAYTSQGLYVAGLRQLGTGSLKDEAEFVLMPIPLDAQASVTSVHAAGWNSFVCVRTTA